MHTQAPSHIKKSIKDCLITEHSDWINNSSHTLTQTISIYSFDCHVTGPTDLVRQPNWIQFVNNTESAPAALMFLLDLIELGTVSYNSVEEPNTPATALLTESWARCAPLFNEE